MNENIIFNKIYKNKRYLKKLFESNIDKQIKNLDDNFGNLIEIISKFSVNSFLYTSMSGKNYYQLYYFYPNALTIYNSLEFDTEEQLTNEIKNNAKQVFNYDNILPSVSDIEIYSIKWNHKSSRYINAIPAKILTIDMRNLSNHIIGAEFYKNSINEKKFNSSQDLIDNIKHQLRISQTRLSDLTELLNNSRERIKQRIYDEEKISKEFNLYDRLKDYSLEEINPSKDTLPKENGVINIMSFKNEPNKIRPFIYTKEIVTDEHPRTPDNTCNMLINNVNTLKKNLEISPNTYFKLSDNKDSEYSKIEESINYYNKQLLNEVQEVSLEQTEKLFAKVNSKKKTKDILSLNKNLRSEALNISLNLCDVYKESFEMARKKTFNKNYVNSSGLNYNTHLYLVELLSPLVIAANKCTWQSLYGKDGFEELKKVTGSSGNDFWNENTYIGYYTQSNEPLADSFVFINNKKIQVSTKGGANGEGAAASIVSLRDYIYEYTGDSSNQGRMRHFNAEDWDLTITGNRVKQLYPNEFNIFNILSSIPYNELSLSYFTSYIDNINEIKSKTDLIKYLNNNYNFTDFVMEVLKSAAFDFAQVNAKATSTDDDFHFDFTVHYPAVFSGNVKIESPANSAGYTKFHIMG